MRLAKPRILAPALLVLGVEPALAQALQIVPSEITKGQQSIENTSTLHLGYESTSGTDPRFSNEVSYSYAPTSWLELQLDIATEQQVDGDFVADAGGLELRLLLFDSGSKDEGESRKQRDVKSADRRRADTSKASDKAGKDEGGDDGNSFALGFLTKLDLAIGPDSTNTFTFGPILEGSAEPYRLTLNPFFDKTFGRNSTPGLDFVYGWQFRGALRKGVAIGIEGFGLIENIADAPPWSEQDHRIGPGLYLDWEFTEQRSLGTELGLLFGLTEATPAVSLRMDSTLSF